MSEPASEYKQPESVFAEKIDFASLPKLPDLNCPDCGHVLGVAGIDTDHNRVVCSNCNHAFGLHYDSAKNDIVPFHLAPMGMELFRLNHQMEIILNWSKSASSFTRRFMFLFSGLWNTILLPIAITMLVSGNAQALPFLSIHLLVGLGTFLYALSTIINKTHITVNSQEIMVSSGPIKMPWKGKRRISTQDIEQLYVSRYTVGTENGAPRYAFGLYAITRKGSSIPLIKGMNFETQAYLEKEFEKFLGITNRKVTGEFKA